MEKSTHEMGISERPAVRRRKARLRSDSVLFSVQLRKSEPNFSCWMGQNGPMLLAGDRTPYKGRMGLANFHLRSPCPEGGGSRPSGSEEAGWGDLIHLPQPT